MTDPESTKTPADSLLGRLSYHASTSPDKNAISYLNTSGNQTPSIASSWSFIQIDKAANYLANRLLDASTDGLSPVKLSQGDRVLLVYPPCSSHFLISFLACLRAGLIAVPTYPPHPSRKESLASFAGIAFGSGAKIALTNGEFAAFKRVNEMKDALMSKFKGKGVGWPQISWVVTDNEPLLSPPSHNVLPEPELSTIAFLQYTSGSTSEPKGVCITHANLAHNLSIITNDLKASTSTVVVSWLPQYHDMGLIGSLLGILYCGGSGYYMSPIAFLARPMAWIEAVSQYRGTHLQAPNFAFGLTARKFNPEEYCFIETDGKRALDLTCLKHVINGAEPITKTSIDAFESAFQPFGLPCDPRVIYPTYGLAEHTVFVCSGGCGSITVKRRELEEDNKSIIVEGETNKEATSTLLGCGFPSAQNVDVCIVDPESRTALEEDCVGEIWINSPSKAMGYYGKDDITKSEFHAALSTDDPTTKGANDYLRSGDLGFLHQGELYICGRLKDLIIVGGRNYYPQDLETTAELLMTESLRPGCSAAFSINTSNTASAEGEEIVMLLELKDPLPKTKELKSIGEAITSAVRSEISKEFSLSLSCIVLLKARSVPKTTSGKISRSKARKAFLSGSLLEVYRCNFKESNGNSSSPNSLIEVASGATEAGTKNPPAARAPILPPSNVQSLDRKEIRELLLNAVSQIANTDKSLVSDTAPLNTFMDSVSLAQMKGMLEGQYGVKPLSDEYLFRDTTTLNKLVEIVKVGTAQDDTTTSTHAATDTQSPSVSVGQTGGIAGALGCPPGVVCCTIM